MKFITNWTINLQKLPKYTQFKQPFHVRLNYNLLNTCYKSSNPIFTNDRKQLLEPILKCIDKKTEILEIKHNQRYGVGRFYPDESISPISVSRHIKHTLFHFLNWIDLDMVKGHATIIYNIALKNNMLLESFKNYLENQEKIFRELLDFYSIDNKMTNDHVKDIFNISIYGGNHKTWIESMNKQGIKVKTENEHQLIKEFVNDCKKIINIVYLSNPELIDKIKGDLTIDNDEYKLKNRTISYWCGAIENDIIYICYNFLVKNNVIDKKSCALEFDGICFKRKENHDDTFLDNILTNLNKQILNETGLNIKMLWKKYKPQYIHHDIIDMCINNVEQKYQTFEEVSKLFEKNHCKIKNKGLFIKESNDKIIVMSRSMLTISYENMVYYKQNSNMQSYNFISSWLRNNPNQRCYEDIGCYPPGVTFPNNYFNTWIPFKMKLVKDYTPNPDALDIILNHIKILCNNDESIYDYFIKWIAQMLQFPAVKSICPILISKEGAGKGTLLSLLKKIMGSEKIFETSNPSRDVWGEFNGCMTNSFLINLNELSKRETIESEGKIKALITDSKLTINNKNMGQYEINSYHRFIITTNNDDPIKTTSDDRRKLIIRSSDEKCGDKQYFNELYSLLDNIDNIKTCYEYFISIKDMNKFNLIPLPTTNYQNDLKTLSKSPIEQWLHDFTLQNIENISVTYSSKEVYVLFLKWCEINHSEYKITSIQFSVRLKHLNIKGIEKGNHTKNGENKIFNIIDLKKYFKIE